MSKPPRDKSWHPPLDADDAALWEDVKKSVKRLRPGETRLLVKAKAKTPPKPKLPLIKPEKIETKPPLIKKPAIAVEPAEQFDRMTLRKIKTGRVKVDDSIDLHGLRQDTAHRALESFIFNARERGYKLVLVVTGKGNRFNKGEGVLKTQVPRWLKEGDLSRAVIGFSKAAQSHGGDGAFYVRLKKKRAR
ncbi:MAG: Smr/MutS family protein [Pseudomonadota bacterium]